MLVFTFMAGGKKVTPHLAIEFGNMMLFGKDKVQ